MNPALLGAALVADLSVTDPVGAALFLAMPAPIITWISSNVQADPTKNVPLIAVGTSIVGEGGFTCGSTNTLTTAIASAIGMTDPVGISKMSLVTQHIADTLSNYGHINASSLIAYAGPAPPPTGPVSGTGGVTLSQPFTFYTALSITDAPGIQYWTAFGDALQDHLESFAVIAPTMTNPASGGVVSGTGALS